MKQKILSETNLVTECFGRLQKMIIGGALEPGRKLKVEELKGELLVGGSPIREALSRLVASGLVEAKDNKGFYVTRISEVDIKDVYWTMFQIDMLALRQAMEIGDDAWKSNIVATLYNLGLLENSGGLVEYADWVERNYAFHVALIAGCNSALLMQIRADVYKRFDRYSRMSFNLAQSNLELNHQEHQEIAEAVLEHDVKRVYELMHHHVFGALDDVIKAFKERKML